MNVLSNFLSFQLELDEKNDIRNSKLGLDELQKRVLSYGLYINDKIISSQFNWCEFENCTITTDFHEYSEYTYSMDGHNTYTNVTFNISSDEIYYFYKDKFINCKFKNPKILSKVIFDQCNVNNEPYNTDGDYIIDKNIDLDSITELVLEPEMFVLYEEDDEEE